MLRSHTYLLSQLKECSKCVGFFSGMLLNFATGFVMLCAGSLKITTDFVSS